MYYTKNDETDSLEITSREDCFIVDVNAAEKEALNKIHAANSGTYEGVDAKFENLENDLATANTVIENLNNNINEVTEQNSTFSTKIEELEGSISTLNTEKETAQALIQEVTDKFTSASDALATAQSTIETLTAERDELATYKKNIEDTEKKNLIMGYSDQLDQDVLNSYIADMDKYDLKQLDMELTYKVKTEHPEVFSKNPGVQYIPKDVTPTTGGLESLLAKYEKH